MKPMVDKEPGGRSAGRCGGSGEPLPSLYRSGRAPSDQE